MIKQYCSQAREKIEETDYIIIRMNQDQSEVLLKDRITGNLERWFANDEHSGYTIDINGIGYEFASSYGICPSRY